MRRQKLDLSPERALITNMIVSDQFLTEIMPVLRVQTLQAGYARSVATWVAEYYEQFKRSPGPNIQEIYRIKAKSLEEDDADNTAQFLRNLSEDYTKVSNLHNVPFEVTQAVTYLKRRSLELLQEQLQADLAAGDVVGAELHVGTYNRVVPPTGEGVSLLHDSTKVTQAFFDEEDTLFEFPGALGKVCGRFNRGDFAAFLAPMKRGKCLSGSAKVLLGDGRVRTVAEVVRDKEASVYSLDGNLKIVPSQVSDFWDNGVKPVFKVTTRTGRETMITANHPLFTFERDWQSLDEGLRVGDHIAVPRSLPVFGNTEIPIEHVRLLAYLLADGGLTGRAISYSKRDPVLMRDFVSIITGLGDVCRFYEKGLTVTVTKGSKGPEQTHTSQLLDSYAVLREKSIHKVIPDVVFTLPKEQLQVFLQVLFSGDGSVFDGGIQYSSGSETLIRQLSHLLLRFGIYSKIKGQTEHTLTNGRVYWALDIRDRDTILSYMDQIGFLGVKEEKAVALRASVSVKKPRSYIDVIPRSYRPILIEKMKAAPYNEVFSTVTEGTNLEYNINRNYVTRANAVLKDPEVQKLLDADVLWDRIESITPMGEEHTYDLSVPDVHNFIADDICVHNTWWLWYVAETAIHANLKVVYFTLEMTWKQMVRRAWQSMIASPKSGGTVHIPRFVESGDKWEVEITDEERKPLDPGAVTLTQKKLRRMVRGGDAQIIAVPSYSATVEDLDAMLDNLYHYEQFTADVVIFDYADIIAPSKGQTDYRHQLDGIWKKLRRMAQQRNCLVFTASQAEKSSFKSDIQEGHVAEDIRKLAHVTHMLALNQSKQEKEKGVMRVKQLAVREGRQSFEQALVLQCLDIGRPVLDSRLESQVDLSSLEMDAPATRSEGRRSRTRSL